MKSYHNSYRSKPYAKNFVKHHASNLISYQMINGLFAFPITEDCGRCMLEHCPEVVVFDSMFLQAAKCRTYSESDWLQETIGTVGIVIKNYRIVGIIVK